MFVINFGVYIHWPFCRSKCPYCDFVSLPAKNFDFNAWKSAYAASLKSYAGRLSDKTVASIFFGGGTPSLMSAELVSFVIETIKSLWPVAEETEISMEVNPCSVDYEKMTAFRKAGVNRLSVGVQSLNDKSLKFLGRLHTAEQALEILKTAKTIFPRLSADFIYALPDQSLSDWQNELSAILELNLKHLSLYQLTIEEGTFFYKKGVRPVEDDLAADMFELTDRMMYQAGLERYEVSNHAAPGHECKHNLLYWQGGEWIGIGPAAHGRFTIGGQFHAVAQNSTPQKWLETQACEETTLSTTEKAQELIFMALRTREGLDRNTFCSRIGKQPEEFMHEGTLQDYQTDGFLICDKKGLRTTAKGLMILNALCRTLLK
ncbi:MAG: radical SAM family heme chaperone HemW [Alphaproteobacteria bacterium]|nr:radical SAM family heme chaperone HemW [Alphaproteobacteria bacterium]